MTTKDEVARPAIGQIWRDNDKRVGFRELLIESLDARYAYCKVRRNKEARWLSKTRVRIERLRPTATGYRLVSEKV